MVANDEVYFESNVRQNLTSTPLTTDPEPQHKGKMGVIGFILSMLGFALTAGALTLFLSYEMLIAGFMLMVLGGLLSVVAMALPNQSHQTLAGISLFLGVLAVAILFFLATPVE